MGAKDVIRIEARAQFDMPPAKLWPFLADTPRLNRALGLPPMHFRAETLPDGTTRTIVEYRAGAIPFARWTEHPFTWREPFAYSVQRDMHWGPIASVVGGVELRPHGAGTELTAYGDFTPRNPLGVPFARWVAGPKLTQGVIDQCRHFVRYYQGEAATPFPQLAPPRSQVALDRLGALSRSLVERGLDPAIVARLELHLREAPDEDVALIRPYVLADSWGVDRHEVLVLCLNATVAGLLTMSWHILCPMCRVGKHPVRSMSELKAEGHCDSCNIQFDARFAQLIEARFAAAPSLRTAVNRTFCTGGPLTTPHVVTQVPLAPGQATNLNVALSPGHYLLRSAQAQQSIPVEVTPDANATGPTAVSVELFADGATPAEIWCPPGQLDLAIRNRLDLDIVVSLEHREWPDTVVTAANLSTVAEFRDLFSAEVLAPGLEVAVEHLGFLFTDLTGSTALYERVGQARAFRLVQDHFALLDAAIREHSGTIVKTIGDAVMAVFPTGTDAYRAAAAIQQAIRQLDTMGAADPATLVKIGVHQGSCLVVTLNGRLDYFGTTVNVAARLNHLSGGGEIVASHDVLRDAEHATAAQHVPEVEVLTMPIRGLREPIQLGRWRP